MLRNIGEAVEHQLELSTSTDKIDVEANPGSEPWRSMNSNLTFHRY